MTPAFVVLAFIAGFALRAAVNRRYLDDLARHNRRVGWGYGYGAGWVDGADGREPHNEPPSDGRARLDSA